MVELAELHETALAYEAALYFALEHLAIARCADQRTELLELDVTQKARQPVEDVVKGRLGSDNDADTREAFRFRCRRLRISFLTSAAVQFASTQVLTQKCV
jgi:hypothetical protein